IDECARNLQKAIDKNPIKTVSSEHIHGECMLFVDGLKYDMAKQVSDSLAALEYDVINQSRLAELPSLTATCKPALMPIVDELIGLEVDNEDFCPVIKETNQKAVSQRLESLMKKKGWKVLKHGDYRRETEDNAWLDYSHIDEDGHSLGWRIVRNFPRYIDEIVDKVETLFANGWSIVRIVADHGWLMMPGGLPKATIAASLVDSKWGRTAAIKPGALIGGNYYQWYWNPSVHFLLAEGVSCYRANTEYTHGGISLQESILLDLIVSDPNDSNGTVLTITDIVWKGMRCKVAAAGQVEDLRLDIRTKPAMSETSIVMGVKDFTSDGITSVVVDDDIYEGKSAFLVVLDENEKVVYQIATIIGGEQ
ncbi:MAG: PglZ domain-containing protein, partial [Candidatus Cloacimonetes bacterium]|nr:PglZ domain-containing protein [Candidatus Cloacimonadota bacterium]MDY0230605.1 PglZ domain-containing protein [Candidatus Cloacimonadaceae bacterium]